MCSPKLLLSFIMLCNSFLSDHPQRLQDEHALTLQKCVKAYDICVDRKSWDILETATSIKDEEIDNAIQDCEYYLNSQYTFSEFYTDNRCDKN